MKGELYFAATNGDLEFLERQAETKNEEIFVAKTREGNNLIHIATRYEKLEFIESCLEISYPEYYESLLFEGNTSADTPLHVAARVGNFDIVQILFGYFKKAQVDGEEKPWLVQNLHGNTAVHVALGNDNVKIARFLLDMDLDFAFVQNKSEQAPLHLAIRQHIYYYGSGLRMTKNEQLLKERAKSKIESEDDEENMTSMIVFLVKNASSVATLPDIEGLTPLHRAASLSSPYNIMVTKLIKEHCPQSAEVCDGYDKSIVHHLINNKHDEKSDKAMGSGDEEADEGLENMLVYVAMHGDVGVFDVAYNIRDEQIFRKTCAEDNMIHIAVFYEKEEFLTKYMEKYLEKNKKQIREKNGQGNTPLHVAAEVGNLDIVKLLYDYLKKSVEGGHNDEKRPWRAQNSLGNTPLHVAILYQNIDVAKFLLEKDRGFARIVNGSKEAPLHLAVAQKVGEELTGKLLHAATCVTTWPNAKGLTPLHMAVSADLHFIENIIAECPESLQVLDASGKSILHHVAENVFDNLDVKFVFGLPQIYFLRNHQDHQGNTPLHIAATCKNICMVNHLIDSSAKQHVVNSDGISASSIIRHLDLQQPLIRRSMPTFESTLASEGDLSFISLSIKSGGIDFLSSRDSEERNFLHLLTNMVELSDYNPLRFDYDLKRLIKKALKICPQLICQIDQRGDTPLHLLARNTWLSEIMLSRQSDFLSNLLLLSNPSSTTKNNEDDYNRRPWLIQNGEGNTPLHEAILAENKFLVPALLSYSEKTARLVNKHNETPLHLLAGTSNNNIKEFEGEKIIELVNANNEALEMPDKDGLIPVSRALKAKNLYMVVTLLHNVKKIGDIHGQTFWDLFLNHQSIEFVNNLLENQTFRKILEHKDKHGNTPLHLAMKDINKLDMATTICSKAPEAAKLGDIDGCTFWHLLVKHPSYRDFKDKVKDILRNEASRKGLELKDKDGNTPLHLAIKEKHFDFVELLMFESECETSEVDHLLTIPNNVGDTPEDLLADSPTLPKQLEKRILADRRMKGIRSSWGIPRAQLQNYMSSMNVIAALQTTITFTAAFTVPGGLNQDIGTPLLIRNIAFQAFMVSNVIAMCLSMMVLICLLWMVATNNNRVSVMIQDFALWLLLSSFVATLLSFMTGVYATVSPVKPWIAIFTLVLCSFLMLLFPRNILTKLLLFEYRKNRFVKT